MARTDSVTLDALLPGDWSAEADEARAVVTVEVDRDGGLESITARITDEGLTANGNTLSENNLRGLLSLADFDALLDSAGLALAVQHLREVA